MSITLLNHLMMHRPLRSACTNSDTDYTQTSTSTRERSNSNMRGETLLAVHVDQVEGNGLSQFRPFFLPSQNHESSSIEKSLGYGAFGVVWSSIDPRDGSKIALKRIPRVFHNPTTAKRVYREIKMLSYLNHDNIVRLLDVVKAEDYSSFEEIYLLFEFMQTDLHRIIVSSQPLSSEHVKIFLFQILRGIKYLHSAGIIHRDIKPGNMLVNSNCLLKICDFGLARMADPNHETCMTQEVVTQYYRSPELLMEAKHYSYAVDMWSVGCTFAELLSRRILFQANGPLEQIELILNLTGTPPASHLMFCHPDACCFVLALRHRRPNMNVLYALSPDLCEITFHLICSFLRFNPDERISAEAALNHPYLSEARLRYHTCMCTCCIRMPILSSNTPSAPTCSPPSNSSCSSGNALTMQFNGIGNNYFVNLDPSAQFVLPLDFDSHFKRVSDAKKILWDAIMDYYQSNPNSERVVLNTNAFNYQAFLTSKVAQAKEVAAIRHRH